MRVAAGGPGTMLIGYVFRLLTHANGVALALFLLASFLGKKQRVLADRLAMMTLAAVALWHAARAAGLYVHVAVRSGGAAIQEFSSWADAWGALLAPAFLLHTALTWAGAPVWAGLFGYAWAVAVAAGRFSAGGSTFALKFYVSGCLLAAAVGLFRAQAKTGGSLRFHRTLAFTVLGLLLVGAVFPEYFVAASLLPLVCAAYYLFRYNVLDVLISRRTVFVLSLGLITAVYLFVVNWVANVVELQFEAFGALVEITLIFGAAVLWLPVYEWITRFLARRAERYAEFCKELIERAVPILNIGERIDFLAKGVGSHFPVRRVVLYRSAPPENIGLFHCARSPELESTLTALLDLCESRHHEILHVQRMRGNPESAWLEKTGFNYAFPLWYEGRLTGILLVDTAPRRFLDENEPVLLGLSRQISHSLEACRLVEEKIGLEKALLQEEHLASLGRAAATIAHEVKNPLSSIKTLAQLMKEDPAVKEQYGRDLNFIVSETDRLNYSVSQLLSFSRPAPPESAEVSVSDFLESMAGRLARDSAERRVHFEHSIEEPLRNVRVHPQILQHVVLNLALNALQASPDGGTVRLIAQTTPDGQVRIRISDDGPGIPAEIQHKIFDPFFTTKQQGSGLGLAIVKKNLQQLRGKILVESPIADGHGTNVTVTFPAKRG